MTTADARVPSALSTAAAWGWRLIVVGATLYWLGRAAAHLKVVVIPVAVALLLTALLSPVSRRLRGWGFPRPLAAGLVLVLGLAAVVGVITLVTEAFVDGLPGLTSQLSDALNSLRSWLANGPLHLSASTLSSVTTKVQDWLSAHTDSLTSGALSTVATLGEVVTGFLLVLFSTFFLLKDGPQIWRFLTGLLPASARVPVRRAGGKSWESLTAYVRATVLVAFVDAIGIGAGLLIMRVPLTLPLSALVFIGAFIPVVGATLSGAVAVVIAIVAVSPLAGVVVLAIVITIQQIEGHVLQPLIMGRAVALHPLAVIVAISSGLVVGGIVGGLFAVPLLAVLNSAVRTLNEPATEIDF